MFSGKNLYFFVIYFTIQVFTILRTAAQSACQKAVITNIVVIKTVHIQTYAAQNTVFPVDSGLTISVQNAPTYYDLTTTYTVRSIRYCISRAVAQDTI